MRKTTMGGIIALLLAGILTITAGIGSAINGKWFKNSDIKTWFDNWGKGKQEINKPDTPDNGGDASDGGFISSTEEHGISLMSARIAVEEYEDYGIDAQADTAYTLTATVNNDAVDKSVVYGISWKNSSSTWASGKSISEYAVISQSTENGLTATLTIKQGFGEQIIIKVASFYDRNVNATCTVDYLRKMTSFTATLNPSLGSDVGRIYVGDTDNTVSINPTYSVGTVEGTISACETTFTVNDYMKTELSTALSGAGITSFFPVAKIVCAGLTFKIPFMGVGGVNSSEGLIVGGGNPYPPMVIANNFIKQRGCTTALGNSAVTAGVTSISYKITYSYNSEYSQNLTYSSTSFVGFRNDNLTTIATVSDIQLDKSGIVVI